MYHSCTYLCLLHVYVYRDVHINVVKLKKLEIDVKVSVYIDVHKDVVKFLLENFFLNSFHL